RRAELAQQCAVADEIRVAPDRRSEVAVRRAREAGVPEVARVVTRLLERLEDERREGVAAPARLPRVLHDTLARLRGEQGCIRRPEALRRGRRRNAEVGELRQQQLDRLRLRPFVDAVERLAPSPGE